MTKNQTNRRTFIKQGCAVTASALVASVFQGAPVKAKSKNNVLKIATQQQTRPAAPWTVNDAGGAQIISMVGEFLAWQKGDGTLEPRIATSWSPSNNGQSWIFNIRKGIKFHDGTELTADDIVYTFKSHVDPKNGSSQGGNFKFLFDINGVKKINNYKVRFDLLAPNANFPYAVASTSYGACIIKNNADGGVAWTKKMISAGPWIMVEHTMNNDSLFKKNNNYWAKNNSSFDMVRHIQFQLASTAIPQFLTGKIDAIMSIPPNIANSLNKSKFNIQQIPSCGGLHIHMRADWGPFMDKRVRQAAALTLDRKGYISGVLYGIGGALANDSMMDSFPTKDISVPQRKKNIAKAKQLMKKAGVPNGFEVDLSTWNRDDIFKLALFIKASFAEINIKVNLKIDGSDGGGVFFYTYKPFPSVKGKVFEYDNNSWLASNLGISDWVGRGVPDVYLSREWRSTGDWNASHLNSPRLDYAIDNYLMAITPKEKRASSKLIQEASLDETPIIIVYNENVLVAYRNNLKNFETNGITQINVTKT